MIGLDKIKIGVSPLTGEIYIYRHGKKEHVALEKRSAEADVMGAFITYMLRGMPKGATKDVTFDRKSYRLTCKPIDKEPTND